MMLSAADLIALLPLLVMIAGVVAVMLLAAFCRHTPPVTLATLLVLALAFIALPVAATAGARPVTSLLIIDHYALFYMGLVFAATFAIVILSHAYFGGGAGRHQTACILLLLAALGSAVLVASSHFASFLIGLELLSVSLFALIAYPRGAARALEAGIKYLVLAGISSALLLFGMALVYVRLGTMQFMQIGTLAGAAGGGVYLDTGVALILVGIGFKLALVPFHLWTPDVYEGAPAPIAAFVATVSKGAMMALLLRYFIVAGGYRSASVMLALTVIAVVSILAGNLLALLQDNVKRILAYSSIAHLGYVMVAFLATGALAVEAVSYYLVAYVVTMLGAFGVVTLLSTGGEGNDRDVLADFRGLFWRQPAMAAAFTVMLLSLAGIPLTMGFVGKFYVVAAGIGASLWLPVVVLVVGSVIGLYYYLRIIATMCAPPPDIMRARVPVAAAPASVAGMLTLLGLSLVLVWLGVYPASLIRLLHATVAYLV